MRQQRSVRVVNPIRLLLTPFGCLFAILGVGAGFAIGMSSGIYLLPQLFGYHATATVLADRTIELAATEVEINQLRGDLAAYQTVQALDSMGTMAALNNSQNLLQQTAIQSARFLAATQTARAAESVRQQTQIALDYAATQVQLQRNATQVELDYRNTQAALGNVARPVSTLDARDEAVVATTPDPTQTPFSNVARAQAVLSPTIQPSNTVPPDVILPPSDTPTSTPQVVLIDTDFTRADSIGSWLVSDSADWALSAQGLTAQADGARLLSVPEMSGQFNAFITLAPAIAVESDYYVLLNVSDTSGLALHIETTTLSATSITLYEFERRVFNDRPLDAADMVRLRTVQISADLRSETTIVLTIRQTQLSVVLNGESIMVAELPPNLRNGKLGVQLPATAHLLRLQAQTQNR